MSGTVMPALLLGASLIAPVGLIFACLSRRLRERMPSLLWLAPLPALAAALFGKSHPRLVLDQPPYYVTLAQPRGGRFAVYWLLTLTGCLGVFMAADLWSFCVLFTVVSLAAYGLVVQDGTPRARRAGVIYLALAVLGEACVLMGFVLLAAATPGRSLLIRDADAGLGGA